MISKMSVLMLAGLMAATSAQAAASRPKEPATDVTTLAAKGEPRNCIHSTNVNTRQSGTRAIMFRQGANQWYRNDLAQNCPALGRDYALVFRNIRGSQYCEMDMFDVVDTTARMRLGTCSLGKFTPVEVPKGTKF